MNNIDTLKELIKRFDDNIGYYKNNKNSYNEHSCRIEYIDPLLEIIGWDVANKNGVAPQYREVIAENYSSKTDRPDYSLTLRGVSKIFVEAKKPAVDICSDPAPAIQARKYGWNAKHKIVILTNFENLIIYDTTSIPNDKDNCAVSRYRSYNYKEYADKIDEICSLISRDTVYSGEFDKFFERNFHGAGSQKQQVDEVFLSQINTWRIALSNELYVKGGRYTSLEVLNDVVQEFINQIVFLRICEDKNLPLYHNLSETILDSSTLQNRLEELFRAADKRYNSGMFSGKSIIFDLNSKVITEMISGLYYPQSPYIFSIIEPNMLGKIYEMFLTEQLTLLEDNTIALAKKKECKNRSIVTTPTEIVRYMVEKTLSKLCENKKPDEIYNLHIADIACGSGIFLEEVFQFLQYYCVEWYLKNDSKHLIEIGNGNYKLPLEEKKHILCSCIYGVDIDVHAVEVAKFSLLIKLIENETTPSVASVAPILPNLSSNIFHGNSLVNSKELSEIGNQQEYAVDIIPFDWDEIGFNKFDAIVGNPPYVSTEDMHALIAPAEFFIYKKKYKTSHKQFDKYFIFLERAIQKTADHGFVCYIIPNKFFKVGAGEKLRALIAENNLLVSLDDFGDAQLFEDKTIYSSIVLLQKERHDKFLYNNVKSAAELWSGKQVNSIELESTSLNMLPWCLTSDFEFLSMLKRLENVSVPITTYVDIFNGIQTSAESPQPIYWFSSDDVKKETADVFIINRNGTDYLIEKSLLKPYFKPTKKAEKGLNSYSVLQTDKLIIFPYDNEGKLIPIETMQSNYPGIYAYLSSYFNRLVPKSVSDKGYRDVPNATANTWYQYGRTQALTSFINTPKLIVGVLSKQPMYILDNNDILISSGGTAGYCAISRKPDSPYALEYIQAWLSNSYTEKLLSIVGSDFEGGFIARGTFVLSTLPFVKLNLSDLKQKAIYDRVVSASREIYDINAQIVNEPPKHILTTLSRQKKNLIDEIEKLICRVYMLDF